MRVFAALRVLGIALACVIGLRGRMAAAQPLNNLCANAQVITIPGNALSTAVTVHGTTVNATSDIMQTCGLGDESDVWYSFTAPVAGIWYFDTINSVLFDTTLAIYSSCGGAQLACNDDIDFGAGYYWSAITLNMAANQTVRIRVSANNVDEDVFQLNIVGAESNASNSCATAEVILANQPRSGSTLGATTDFALPAASCGSFPGSKGGRDIFYVYTPAMTGPHKVTLCSSGFDTTLAILTNCSGSGASVVACNDDSPNCSFTNRSELPAVSLTAGVQYRIRVAGFDFEPADFGTYTLLVTPLTIGSCCIGSTCAFINVVDCNAPAGFLAGRTFGNAPNCNLNGSLTAPCCYADYNKVNGITVQDIFDFLSDWFRGSALTAIGTSGTSQPTVPHIFAYLNAWFAGGC